MSLAAIQVALAYGLDVHATVPSKKEKELLLQRHAALNGENIVIRLMFVIH